MNSSLAARLAYLQGFPRAALVGTFAILAAGCGGGGGGGSSSGGGGVGGTTYRVQAAVQSDSCGERLAPVNQLFTIDGNTVDTSLVTLTGESVGGGVHTTFTETNGDCTRTYEATLTDISSASLNAELLARTQCGSSTCETRWRGIGTAENSRDLLESELAAAEEGAADELEADGLDPRVRGENCNPNVPPTVHFRPSLFECNGNSAVLLEGSLRNNYSVVVRRDGQYNDRDPNNPTCGTNRCSPYKTQKRMELTQYQVNCLGDSGFSAYYQPVNRISIKFTASVTNANDTRQFEQYCLPSTTTSLN